MELAEKLRAAEVTVFSPLVSPSRHPLASPTVSIGRAAECGIPIKDRFLSRKHAEIVSTAEGWALRDCGSANGTFINGNKVERETVLCSGDRIRLGDTEILYQSEPVTDKLLAIADSKFTPTISIPVDQIVEQAPEQKSLERFRILNALAMELIEDQPQDRLFGFIVDRVMEHLKPSRAAIGLLAGDGLSFVTVEVRRRDTSDSSELSISRTLLAEVVQEKKALAFMNVAGDEKLSRAKSIILQGIHSVLCAPLLVGNAVVGVLYVDYLLNQRVLSEEDVRLIAQIARFAAIKIENTRLREGAIQKLLIDEELKTAYLIQKRLLPTDPPKLEQYSFAGLNHPCRTVSGDYYDFVVRPDGRVYFTIADVSGKGVTAALLMAGLQASFRIFTKTDPSPAELVEMLNAALKENLPQSKFVTLFAGRLDPESGTIEYVNAGHSPPVCIRASSVETLASTDLILGMFPKAKYQNQTMELGPGDALVLFTDGVSEAENAEGEEFGESLLGRVAGPLHGHSAAEIAEQVEKAVTAHAAEQTLSDDVTLLVVSRSLAVAGTA